MGSLLKPSSDNSGFGFTSIACALLVFLAVFSGRFTTERLGFVDFEVRFLFIILALLVIPILRPAVSNTGGRSGVALSFIFFFAGIIAGFQNLSGDLAIPKIVDLGCIFLTCLVAFWAFSGNRKAVMVFLYVFAFFGFLYALMAILSLVGGGANRGSIGVGGPNVATRIIFLGGLSAFYIGVRNGKSFLMLLSPIYAAGIIAIGSRGGMGAAALTVFLGVFLTVWHSKASFFSSRRFVSNFLKYGIGGFVVIALFSWFLFPLVEGVFQSRFLNLVVDRVHYAGRDSIYDISISAISDNILTGLGLGGYTSIGISNYPHNIVLELLLDGGIFWLFFLFSFIYFAIRFTVSSKSSSFLIGLALVYMLLVQQLSGDYYDFRYYFIFLIIVDVLREEENLHDAR